MFSDIIICLVDEHSVIPPKSPNTQSALFEKNGERDEDVNDIVPCLCDIYY